jgi:uncharacterized membrane protein
MVEADSVRPGGTNETERRRDERRAEHEVRRLEAYSDGVFAIAATLLVLDLTVGELGPILSDSDLWTALTGHTATLVAFVVSFLLLCLLWWIHTKAFEDVVRLDGVMVVLNSLRLLGVVLIPFTTSLSSTFGDLQTGSLYLALNFFVIVLIGAVQGWYATDPRRGIIADVDEADRRDARLGGLSAVILSVLTVVLAPLLGSLAFVAFALDPLLGRWLQRSPLGRPRPTDRP